MAYDPQNLFEDFARRLAEVRRKKGYTQDGLADKANVTGGYIRLLESGSQNVTLATIGKFADLLNCDPKIFFDKPKSKKPLPGRPKTLKRPK